MAAMARSDLNRRDKQCAAFAYGESLAAVTTTARVKLYGMDANAIKRCLPLAAPPMAHARASHGF